MERRSFFAALAALVVAPRELWKRRASPSPFEVIRDVYDDAGVRYDEASIAAAAQDFRTWQQESGALDDLVIGTVELIDPDGMIHVRLGMPPRG